MAWSFRLGKASSWSRTDAKRTPHEASIDKPAFMCVLSGPMEQFQRARTQSAHQQRTTGALLRRVSW